jgi:uncharacterized membrane protein
MVRGFLGRLGLALCIAAGAICALLHVATFITMVPPVWVLPSFALLFGAVLCAQAAKAERRFKSPARNWTLFGFALFVYAVLTFVYFYRTTGGASSVNIVDGQYVSMYKGRIIRTITEHEYRMIPNLWTRVMSAWISMMAFFGLMQFSSTDKATR